MFYNISQCFDHENRLQNKDLEDLLNITKIKHNCYLDNIADSVFNNEIGWLRNGERDQPQTKRFDNDFDEIFRIAKKLGFVENLDELKKTKHYDALIIHGSRAMPRFSALVKDWKEGVRFTQIIVITTNEVIFNNQDSLEADYPQTELGYMHYIYNKLLKEENCPEELKATPVIWLDTPGSNGERPHTKDTIVKLIKDISFDKMKKIIAVSNQPFIQYQNKLLQILLYLAGYHNLKLFNLGLRVKRECVSAPIILDSIGRALKLEKIFRLIKLGQNEVIEEYI